MQSGPIKENQSYVSKDIQEKVWCFYPFSPHYFVKPPHYNDYRRSNQPSITSKMKNVIKAHWQCHREAPKFKSLPESYAECGQLIMEHCNSGAFLPSSKCVFNLLVLLVDHKLTNFVAINTQLCLQNCNEAEIIKANYKQPERISVYSFATKNNTCMHKNNICVRIEESLAKKYC